MSIAIGSTAPDFVLYASDKTQVHLAELRGVNVLLLFFPLAFSSTCTRELCLLQEDLKQYEALHAVVFGISVDALHTLAAFKKDLKLSFELLSDFNKEVSCAYGAQYEEFSYGMRGVSKRAAFVIDKSGLIQYAEVLENASHLPNFEAIVAMLTELN